MEGGKTVFNEDWKLLIIADWVREAIKQLEKSYKSFQFMKIFPLVGEEKSSIINFTSEWRKSLKNFFLDFPIKNLNF
jgi:hypothetical protein